MTMKRTPLTIIIGGLLLVIFVIILSLQSNSVGCVISVFPCLNDMVLPSSESLQEKELAFED